MRKKVISSLLVLFVLLSVIFPTYAEVKDPALRNIFGSQEPTISLVKEKLSLLIGYTTKKFKDIKSSDWFVNSLSKLVGLSGIDGYSDGTFKAQKSITVAEFTKTLLAAAGYTQAVDPKVWYNNYVDKAKELSVIEASDNYVYTDGMKRKDMAKMICKLLKIEPMTTSTTEFSDAKGIDTKWIDTAFNEYLIRGYYSKGIRTFKPDQTATRAEVTEMVVRALEYREDPVAYKNASAKYYGDLEKNQDAKDGIQSKVIRGYTIPINPLVNLKTDFGEVELFLSIDIKEAVDTQYKEAEDILASKFDRALLKDAMDYVKQLKDASSVLEKKEFKVGGQLIVIGGQAGIVSIFVYPK